ncbi:MAG: amidohydrolase family protein [Candidatus Bipolaricaulia bacterium]
MRGHSDFHIHVSRYGDYKPWVHELQRRSNPELYEGDYKITPELWKIPDKVVFGSDWPAAPPIALTVEAVKGLPLDGEMIEKILGGNARKLLRL